MFALIIVVVVEKEEKNEQKLLTSGDCPSVHALSQSRAQDLQQDGW